MFTRRDPNQNHQSKYINQALLKEVIENNKMTLIFQNEKRTRAGKLKRPSAYDLSVRWLLEAFLEMPIASENLVIVPVMTSYDRIFERDNITKEMIKNETQRSSWLDLNVKVVQTNKDKLGSVFIKYLEPIKVKKWLKESGFANFDGKMLSSASFELTKYLYRQ